MESWKDQRLRQIEARARTEAAYLANEFVRAAEAEREHILAALKYEKELAQSCREALGVRL